MKQKEVNLNSGLTIFYDGWCRLCSGVVGLLQKTKAGRQLNYVSLQNLEELPLDAQIKETISQFGEHEVVVLNCNTVTSGASAGLEVLNQMGGIYTLAGRFLSLLPMRLLNKLYRFIATKRYVLFGRKSTCQIS